MAQDDSIVEYRDVPGFTGYRVGSDGTVWSCLNKNGSGPTSTWKQIKAFLARRYWCVGIRSGGRKHTVTIHTAVLCAFVGPRPEGMWGLHRNDDRNNNSLGNVYWGTPSQNAADRFINANGRWHPSRGADRHNAVLTEDQVKKIKWLIANGYKDADIARLYSVKPHTVYGVRRGERWAWVSGMAEPDVLPGVVSRKPGFASMTKEKLMAVVNAANRAAAEKSKAVGVPGGRSLTPEQVKQMRVLHQSGMTYSDIARMFRVTGTTAKAAIAGERAYRYAEFN